MGPYNHDQPRTNDPVWVEGVKPQPNGYIIKIDDDTEEATVVFHGSGDVMYIPIERLLGNKQGNVWMIYAEAYEPELHTEPRLDVMVLWDLTPKTADNVPRLLFLCKYFKYRNSEYANGCKRRRAATFKLMAGSAGVNWAEYNDLMRVHSMGRAISVRLKQSLRT